VRTERIRFNPPHLPRKIDVHFGDTQTPLDVSPQGENASVILALHLPPQFRAVESGLLLCQRDGALVYSGQYGTDESAPTYIKSGKLYVTLWRDLTYGKVLRLQATGNAHGGATIKTPISPPLLFRNSLPDDQLIDAPDDLLTQLLADVRQCKQQLDALEIPELHLAADADIDALFN
jgi:hypothetical protein